MTTSPPNKTAAPKPEARTKPANVAEGRGAQLDPASAGRIAAASKAAGHPVPPHVEAALKPSPATGGEPKSED